MKLNKSAKIYKIYNSLKGDEIIINFRPNKQDLLNAAIQKRWGANDEKYIRESIDSGYYTYIKLNVYEK